MKKFAEKENEEEPNDTRYSLDFPKKEKDIMFQSQTSLKENRPLSAKPLLFRKYIPKLKPVQSYINPSFMHLGGIKENFKPKKYQENLLINKNNINIVAEEDYEKGRAAWAQDWVIFTIAEVFKVNLVILRDFDEDFYTLYSNYDIINPDWNTIVIKHGGNHFKALKWKISDDELEKEISEEFKEIYGKFEVECRNIWLNLKFGAAVSTKQLRDGYRRAIDQLDLEWKRIKEKKDERMEVDDNIQDP